MCELGFSHVRRTKLTIRPTLVILDVFSDIAARQKPCHMTTNLPTRVSSSPQTGRTGANNSEETARITSAGGFVEFGRVNGNLALSRALGDFEFKQNFALDPEKQIVTADPEFVVHDIDGEEEFIVVACDGECA
jgi:hypothetical protein